MKSKYASSKPCSQCKAEWKVGDEIFKINDKYWCSNAKCPEPLTPPTSDMTQHDMENVSQLQFNPTPQAKEDATLDNVILRENLLLDQIEDSVKNHLEKKYPLEQPNGQRIGMRVKEIYRKINR